jgi:hypothetical protein
MQQIGGANAVIYFAPVIFEQNLGLTRQLALILGGVNVTVYALAAFASFPLIERVGRRKLFLLGSAGQVSRPRSSQLMSHSDHPPGCFHVHHHGLPHSRRPRGESTRAGTGSTCIDCRFEQIEKGAVFGLFLYLIFFGFTWLELPWLYPAEVRSIRRNSSTSH